MEEVESRVLLSFSPNPATWNIIDPLAPNPGGHAVGVTATAVDTSDSNRTYRYFAAAVPGQEPITGYADDGFNYIRVFRIDQGTGAVDATFGVHDLKPDATDGGPDDGNFSAVAPVDLKVGGNRVALLWNSGPLFGRHEVAISEWWTGTGGHTAGDPITLSGFTSVPNDLPGASAMWLKQTQMPDGKWFPATSIDVQDDGKVLLAGSNWIPPGPPGHTAPPSGAVWRLNDDGTVDTGFGSGGKYTDSGMAGFYGVTHIGSSVYAGAMGGSTATGKGLIVRLTSAGVPDSNFTGGPLNGYVSPYASGTAYQYHPMTLGTNYYQNTLVVGTDITSSPSGGSATDVVLLSPTSGAPLWTIGSSGRYLSTGANGAVSYDPVTLNSVVGTSVFDASGTFQATVAVPFTSGVALFGVLSPDNTHVLYVQDDGNDLMGQEVAF